MDKNEGNRYPEIDKSFKFKKKLLIFEKRRYFMIQATHRISIATHGKGLYNIQAEINAWVSGQTIRTGLLTVFIRHTSASLVVQENADPDVLKDLTDFFERLVPENNADYRHCSEGPDDMPAHIRAVLSQTQLSVPLTEGRLALGTWQDIYVFEHRTAHQRREVALHLLGE